MRVTASEILQKLGAPLPGAGAFPSARPRLQMPKGRNPAAPAQPDPAQAPGTEEAVSPEEAPQEGQEPQEENSIQGIVQSLSEHFSDERIQSISQNMLTLMKVVPPESGEKISKVFTKLMEAMMAMKANIAALEIMAMPAQQQQQMMQQNLSQLSNVAPGADQSLKSGPIT